MDKIDEVIQEILSIDEGKGKLIPLGGEKIKYHLVALNYPEEEMIKKPKCKRFVLSVVEILGDYDEEIKKFKDNIPNDIKEYGNKACREVRNSEVSFYTEPYTYENRLRERITMIINSIKNPEIDLEESSR